MVSPDILKEWDTEHGHVVSGIAFDELRGVEIPYRQGRPHSQSVFDHVVVKTGLTADLKSLELFGNVALELGVNFVSVGHKHKNAVRAIRENSRDVQFIVRNLVPDDAQVHAAGLSRGWAGIVLAGIHMPERLTSLSAVSPAMMAPVNPLRLWKMGSELAIETARNPREFGGVLLDSVCTVRSRLGVTISEAVKVGVGGFVHGRVRDLRDNGPNVKLHLAASKHDCFFDPGILEGLANELGFDTYTLFDKGSAGHAALAYNPELSKSVIATAIETLPDRNRHLLSKQIITTTAQVA